MLGRATRMLVQMHVHVWCFFKNHVTGQSEGCSWRMLYRWEVTFGPFCICSHTFSLHNKPAVYKLAVKLLCLKWKPHRNESLSTFIVGMVTWKPGQILPTHSVLQLAVEHRPECSDPWKIKNTASHVVQIHTDLFDGFFPRSEAARAWSWQKIIFIALLKNEWRYVSFLCVFSWHWEKIFKWRGLWLSYA